MATNGTALVEWPSSSTATANSHQLSAAMVEALAAAHDLRAALAVSRSDVGPHLRAAALDDDITFNVL